jgi:hypothetical protein
MPSYNLQVALRSFFITKSVIIKMEDYLRKEIAEILNIKAPASGLDSSNISIVIHETYGQEVYSSLKEYKHELFRDDTKMITLKFELNAESENVEINLRFGLKPENSDMTNSIQGFVNPREKVSAIEEGILSILDHQKNLNWLIYPNQLISGIIGLVAAGSFIMLLGERFSNQVRYIFGSIVFLIGFYYYGCRAFKGYCIFESNKQKQLDKWFSWLVLGAVGFVLFTTLLTSIRKAIFGF